MFIHLLDISFSELEKEVFHHDFRVYLGNHAGYPFDIMILVDVNSQNAFNYVGLRVIQLFFDRLWTFEVLQEKSDFESLAGKPCIDNFQHFYIVTDMWKIVMDIIT